MNSFDLHLLITFRKELLLQTEKREVFPTVPWLLQVFSSGNSSLF